MKSAYELAMEKLGGTTKYTAKQRAQFGEIDERFKARSVEEQMSAEERAKAAAGDPGKLKEIQRQLEHELAKIQEQCATEKDSVRERG